MVQHQVSETSVFRKAERSSTDWHNSMSEVSAWCFNHNWMAQSWLYTMNSFLSPNYKSLIFHPGISGIFCPPFHLMERVCSQGRPSVVTRLWLCDVPSCIQRVVADLTLEDRTCLNLLFSSCMLGDLGLARWRPPRLFSPFTPPSARNTWSTDKRPSQPRLNATGKGSFNAASTCFATWGQQTRLQTTKILTWKLTEF